MLHPLATRHFAVIAALLALTATLGCDALVDRVVDAAVERQTLAADLSMLEDDALHVFLCGTGSPLPDPDAAGACTIVAAGGDLYVVDVGPGSQEVAQLAGVPTQALRAILLTHFHSDHIGELGEWATQSWIAGRTSPLLVYGPEGVSRVVGGFKMAYGFDDEYRIAHHGEEVLPRTAGAWTAQAIPYHNGRAIPIFKEDGLLISTFAVDHTPVEPAVGYRFEYKGRTVVISGDTDVSPNLGGNARGADLLIHEVLLKKVISQVSEAVGAAGRPRLAKLAGDILDYHTSPNEATEIAKDVGVDTLVFTHIVPPVPGPIRNWMFMRDIDAGDVNVMLGEDGMHFRLPVDSETIEIY